MVFSMMPLSLPTVSADEGRDASISVTVTPSEQTVNPGEAGEYTVRVTNLGETPVTIQLSTAEEGTQECGAYTSSIIQISTTIESGSYEETTMTVTLTANAESSCDTTVTATANESPEPPGVPGQPDTKTSTVTTTAGDGSGNALFGVDLSMEIFSKTWGGEVTTEWVLVVENKGQNQADVNLVVDEITGGACTSQNSLSPDLSSSTVSLDANETKDVTISLNVDNEEEADKYCWEVTGTVSSDPTGNTSDTQEFDITVPILKKCGLTLSKSTMSIEPDEDDTLKATFANEGNSDWTIRAAAAGPKAGWVAFVGGTSGLLPYDDGSGSKVFDLKVTPDDSVTAGEEQTITIQGKDGTTVKCSSELTIIVGQSYGATISLINPQLNNIEPGTSGTTSVTVENTGNGLDNFRVTPSTLPAGWSVELDQNVIALDSKHTPERKETVGVTVSLPTDALATEVVNIVLSVAASSGGQPYDEVTLSVSVAEVHEFETISTATTQTGKKNNEVKFPFEIDNTGNVEDSFRLSVISQTASPGWSFYFEDSTGNRFTEVDVDARTSKQIFCVVAITDTDEYTTLTVRITNKDDSNSIDENSDGIPDNQRELKFTAFLTTRDYAMDIRLENGGLDGRTGDLILAPGDDETIGLWLRNMGNGDDIAAIELTGLTGIATRTITSAGLPVGDELAIPFGYGIWDENNSRFVTDASGVPYLENTANAAEDEMYFTLNLSQGHSVKPYEKYLKLKIVVNEATLTGEGGNLNIVVTSKSNAANRSGTATVSLSVKKIFNLQIVQPNQVSFDITYPEPLEFDVQIRNDGNVGTCTAIFASENMRGWKITLVNPDKDTVEDEQCQETGSSFDFWIEQGETKNITVEVKSPYNAEFEDTFDFTISAQPEEIGVIGRVNQQFDVTGDVESSLFGFADNTTVAAAGGGFVLLILLGFIISRRS
jgi:uncharacterized membrane protein